ncbi:dihydrolipoamide acetyltransferase family protein [Aeromicrobium endophyticum]
MQQFHLPDVGEGLTEAEIVTWLVAAGDVVEVNQILVEIETAKSLVELPSPFAGEVTELHAEPGDTVEVGKPIISIATAGATTPTPSIPEARPATEDEPKLLVGYGAKETSGRRRRRGAATPAPAAATPAPAAATPAPAAATPAPAAVRSGPVRCKPPVRKLAKVLGVDLAEVTPTGLDGIVTRADVLAASTKTPDVMPPPAVAESSVDEIRIPIKGVRKHTAAAMVSSAFTAPHVTEFVTLDITATMELRERLASRRDMKDVKLSPLTFIARAFLRAMERTPSSNSRWDEEAQEIVQLRDINLGIAAATPRGLVVPNIRAAQRLSLAELADAIADLATTARAGRTTPEAMSHGTATISNFGVFGVDTGTPILNPGETVILGVGTISRRPWVVGEGVDERIEPRWVTTLALSFDHRVMDGQQGSELLADTAAVLRDPALAVL